MSSIIVDLDGTLCNHDHRLHYAKIGDWTTYDENLVHDKVVPGVKELIYAMSRIGNKVILASGRSEKYRKLTIQWLYAHDVIGWRELHMRKDGDQRPNEVLKQEMITEVFPKDILFAIDDNKQVIDMFRANGILSFQCADWEFAK